jgi:predicted ATPase/class 3 adenylate cyclase/DNA-binding CsgD family transcriptional regulator
VSRSAARALPTGTVTFVLADIEGSVRLWESQPEAMATATARFDRLISELVEAHGGVRPAEQGEGDSFVAAFAVADDAVACVVALQRGLHSEPWATSLPLRVRAAVHTGAAQLRDSDNYMGPTVNRCARLRGLAHGGQTLLSGATSALVADDLADGVTVLDLGLHPLRDFDRAEHVFQLAHPELPSEFPPLRDELVSRPGLPRSMTTFVARTEEMADVAQLLRRERLVTLTGAGGSGKTRLALACAWRETKHFADGVAWADAAPIADGGLLVSCVAGALGVREVPSESLVDTVVREVGNREVLLVIDNCEHVIDDAARLGERLLGECAGLRILATSREPIGVNGETSMRVPSLDDVAAVQLFVDRARAASSGFILTPATEEVVAEVCRRLDGIPLAIELAAARVRVLSPQQIAEGLADRFRLLTGGARTALPRQRTLEASVDWSYRLLSDVERTLLDRLSVFAGGFTLDATEAVCSDDVVRNESVLDVLTALVDKSLVQTDAGGAGLEARYRVLETIRHFARQRLADAPDAKAVRDRHLDYFLALAEEMGPRVEGGDEVVWLDRLDGDIDNLRAALDWAEQRRAARLLLRLAGALWLFWEVRCRFEEGCAWLHRALSADPEATPARATALHGLGDISLFTLDIEAAVAAGTELLGIGEQLADPTVIARGTTLLGWASCFGAYRDTSWARHALNEALAGLPEDVAPWLYCDAGTALALTCIEEGDLRAAAVAGDEALASASRSRSIGGLQRSFLFRGWIHVLAGEVDEGEALLLRAIDVADQLVDTFWRTLSLALLAYGKFVRGDRAGAAEDAAEAVALGERYRNPIAIAVGGATLALVLAEQGDDDDASSMLDIVSPIAEQVGLSWLLLWVAGAGALIEARRGRVDAARDRLQAAAVAVGGHPYARGHVALYRGWVERLANDDVAAEWAFTEALEACVTGGAQAEVAEALDQLGVSAARREQHDRAARLFAMADAERTRLGVAPRDMAGVPNRDAEVTATRTALGDGVFAAESEAGAELTVEEAVRFALRGRGGRRRPASGWESLTPTELEVVRLVSEGLTNPEIAERLLISRGTAKVHISHVFTKLGLASRAELAAEATRRTTAS